MAKEKQWWEEVLEKAKSDHDIECTKGVFLMLSDSLYRLCQKLIEITPQESTQIKEAFFLMTRKEFDQYEGL